MPPIHAPHSAQTAVANGDGVLTKFDTLYYALDDICHPGGLDGWYRRHKLQTPEQCMDFWRGRLDSNTDADDLLTVDALLARLPSMAEDAPLVCETIAKPNNFSSRKT